MKRLRIFFLALCFIPLFAAGQDSVRLPQGYVPYYNWDSLGDSLFIEYQVEYPERWTKDSIYYALKNKHFLDSALADSVLRPLLFFVKFGDTVAYQPSLTSYPPSNTGTVVTKPIPYWIFWVVLGIALGLVFLKYVNVRLFNLLFLSFLYPRYCEEALREHDTPVNVYNLMAVLICSLIYTIFVWFMVIKPGWITIHTNSSISFLMVFMGISVFYLLRFLIIMLAAAVLDAEHTYGVLVQVTVSGNMWLAVLLLPAMALINSAAVHFASPLLPLYLAMALFIYLIAKQVRVFVQVASGFPHSILYLILYLCALEIAPYLAIFKVLTQQTG